MAFETVIIRIERKKEKEEGEGEGRERERIFNLFLPKFRASRRRRSIPYTSHGSFLRLD